MKKGAEVRPGATLQKKTRFPRQWHIPAGRVPAGMGLSSVIDDLRKLKDRLKNLKLELQGIAGEPGRLANYLGTMSIDSHGQICTARFVPLKPGNKKKSAK
jgi:hypothetical protein